MRIILFCSSLIPEVSEKLNKPYKKAESWIESICSELKNKNDCTILYLFPFNEENKKYSEGNFTFQSYIDYLEFNPKQIEYFKNVVSSFNPDIIHCFGTEYPHTYAMTEAAGQIGMADKVIISIQGLVSVIAKHGNAFLPDKVINGFTLRDFVRKDSVRWQNKRFAENGVYEQKAIKNVKHVIGRTEWDYACVKRINPEVNYHFCNEMLRDSFYCNHWSYDSCERHSIFVSQVGYSIKGFHIMLEALYEIKKTYPDVKLYATGKNPLAKDFHSKIRLSYYYVYLGKLIKKYNLENNVEFLGFLDEKEMCNAFLKANVFVLCSSIENSPNSLGEAMILGMPCIASDVGGVKDMIEHNKEGFVYQADAPYMLAHYVMKMFKNTDEAVGMGINARTRALNTFNRDTNTAAMINIYEDIIKSEG